MDKEIVCKKCGKTTIASGPKDHTPERSTNIECADPRCKHPNEILWPVGTAFTKRLK
jgi:phage FluMu protein Com